MSDIYKEPAQIQEEYRRVERGPLFKELQQNPEPYDILIAHGSNSGSLVGFVEEQGLIPAGWILAGKSTTVPFSGELSKGHQGINQEAVSFSDPSGQHKALEYATTANETTNNIKGWTPELGRRNIENYRSQLEDPFLTDKETLQKIIQPKIEIEERRLVVFPKLSPQEQDFVSNPFPVVYGVHYQHSTSISPSIKNMHYGTGGEIPGEAYIEGKVDASFFTLFVPRMRIEETEKYLKAKGNLRVPVFPLEVYSFLVQRDWANWDLSGGMRSMFKQARTLSERFPTLHHYVEGIKRWVQQQEGLYVPKKED